jgi:hypothetical protein
MVTEKTAMIMMVVSGVLFAASFVLVYLVKKSKKLKDGSDLKQTLGDLCGALMAFSLFALLDSTVQRIMGTSFFQLWQTGSSLPAQFLMAGALQGIVYEYVGQFTFPLWIYPAAEKRRYLLLGLPLFWAIYMLVMQDTWAIVRHSGVPFWLAIFVVALIQYVIIEGFNLWSNSWNYKGPFKRAPALYVGWIILTLTFVVGYNHFVKSPFGY